MTKEQQDLSWACLPKEARDKIKIAYKSDYVSDRGYQPTRGMEVLQNVFGFHNLASDTEPEEMLMVERKKVIRKYKFANICDKDHPDKKYWEGAENTLINLFGDKCLPDTPDSSNLENIGKDELEHRLEQTAQASVQGKPKFSKGDKVIVKANAIDPSNHIGEIAEINYHFNPDIYKVKITPCGYYIIQADDLEPYTEPKFDMGFQFDENDKVMIETEDIVKKELNLCELLKGCEGEEFYSLIDGEVKLKEINDNGVICQCHSYHLRGHLFGCSLDGVCQLYPSRALYEKYPLDAYSAWMEWKEKRKPKLEQEVYDYAKMCSMDVDGYKVIEAAVIFGMELAYKNSVWGVEEVLQKFNKKNIGK